MATQTFVTDMQAINPSSVQQVQQATSQAQQTAVQQSVTQASALKTQPVQTQAQQTTIIQPAQAHTGQQFIVTISGQQDTDQQQETVQLQQAAGQAVYPAHVQYVEGSSDPTIYAAANGQMQSYSDFTQPTMYTTPVSGTYYQAAPAGAQMSNQITQIGGVQGQILTHQGGTYLVQGGTMDGEGHPLTHTTRASPATPDQNVPQMGWVAVGGGDQRVSNFDAKSWQREVQWLIDNYETAEGVSLPRSTLYNHYLRHCQEQKMDPMNPASFGKLIRSVFLGLRTRRLGTRGNSKYHYYGIRIKATSPLNQFTDDQTMAMRQQPVNQGKRFKPAMAKGDGTEGAEGNGAGGAGGAADAATTQQQQHQQYLGDGAIPNFGSINMGSTPLTDGVTEEHVKIFEQLYKEHSEGILDAVVNLQFSLIEALWQIFWRNNQPENQQNGETEAEKRLPKDKLYAMCKFEPVRKYVQRSDYAFYQALVEVLIPDVLRPIPSSLTQAIRNFAKSLEGWLRQSMAGVPDEMIKTKVGAVSAFAQTLRRYTSLNHLAQAARAVLQNNSQINQMLTDLNRVDFANVQEQASWVCQCDDAVVHQLEQDFKNTLQQQNSLEQWAVWLEGVVNQVLRPHEGSPNFPKAARQFLLKWSFYSSMVIRDLTLRSAASFGSFHLIRLLYDEYMFYLVERKVATATGETPIAVMGEVRQLIDLGSVIALGSLETLEPAKTTAALAAVSKPTAIVATAPVPATAVGVSAANITPVMAASANPTTVTVVASGAAPGGTKTIVVVPVSAAGSGDAQPTKRLKTT